MSENLIFLAQNLVLLRKKNQMTQADLAGELGVKPNTISNYENGNSMPDLDTVQKLTGVFHIPADLLLYTKLTPEVLAALHDMKVEVMRQAAKNGHSTAGMALGGLGGALAGGMAAAVVGGAALVPGVLGLTGAALLGKTIWKACSKSDEVVTSPEPEKIEIEAEPTNRIAEDAGSYYKECEPNPVSPEAAECARLREEVRRKDEMIMELSREIGKLEYKIELLKGEAE
ncbi:MAG: XRE family transcriptional regulator [Bacteroides nordii]|nr:XRE family transcriptional regulator [Bacteroides nordii]